MRSVVAIFLTLALVSSVSAQTDTNIQKQIPHYIRFSGVIQSKAGASVAGVTFALYKDQQGGAPLWVETQNVQTDQAGHYSVLLGSTKGEGLPADVFLSNDAQWLGIKPEGGDELPRVLLVSVPYALKAGDAETLGGRPLSAFLLAPPITSDTSATRDISGTTASASPSVQTGSPVSPKTLQGNAAAAITANFIPLFTNSTGTLGNSAIFQNAAGNIGLGWTNPQSRIVIGAPSGGELLNASNLADQDMQIRVTAPGATDKFSYFGSSTSTNLVLGVGTEKVRITGAGNVGIGTTAPSQKLTVAGTIQSTSGGFKFPDGTTLTSATTQTGLTTSLSYTGSTTTQIVKATQNQAGVASFNASGVPAGVRGDSAATTGYAAGVFGSANSIYAPGVAGVNLSDCAPTDLPPNDPICNSYGVYGLSASASRGVGVWGEAEAVSEDNVGVYGKALGVFGTGVFGNAPGTAAADSDATGVFGLSSAAVGTGVAGSATSIATCADPCVSSAGVYGSVLSTTGAGGLFDAPTNGNLLVGRVVTGTPPTQSTTRVFHVDSTGAFFGKSFTANSADFAEAMDAVDTAQYEPGDVMMIDETGTRRLTLSDGTYSTKVAGIYSTQPAILGTEHLMDDPRISKEVPLAIVGIVPCKVSAENGAIHAGDMLVTASKAGYAMKGTDREKMLGAVVGKALGSLDKGTGVIEVLVSLH
jgi:hypothetical protein